MPTLREYGQRRRGGLSYTVRESPGITPTVTVPPGAYDVTPGGGAEVVYENPYLGGPDYQSYGGGGEDYLPDLPEQPDWWDLPVAGAGPGAPSALDRPSDDLAGDIFRGGPQPTRPPAERPWQEEAAAGQLALQQEQFEWGQETWGQEFAFEKEKWEDLSKRDKERFDFDKEKWQAERDEWEKRFTWEQEKWGEQFGFEQQKWEDITTAQQEQFMFDKSKWEDEKGQWAEELQLEKDRLREMLKIQRLALRKPVWGI